MIQKIQDMPSGCLGFEAVGEVDANDYRDTLIPAVDRALAERGKVRFLYLIGSRFERYSSGAAWEDAKLGLEHFTNWERCAIVTDLDWMDHLVRGLRLDDARQVPRLSHVGTGGCEILARRSLTL